MDHKQVLWEKESDELQTSLRQPRTTTISSYSAQQQMRAPRTTTASSYTNYSESQQIEPRTTIANSYGASLQMREPRPIPTSSFSAPQQTREPKTITTNSFFSSQQTTQVNSLQLNNLNDALNESMEQNTERELELLVANSKLRVAAPEWYPSEPVVQNVYINKVENVPSKMQSRLNIHKAQQQNYTETVNDSGDNSSDYSSDFNRLNQIIATLTKDPGQFHNLFEIFMETLEPYLEDLIAMSSVAELIVDQAINHPNFRYTGARLCWYIEPNFPGFRAELHLKCKKQIEENPDAKNVLPLIAELYSQLPHASVYGSLLISAFKKLIEYGGNENVKCICQALKLTGYSLEQSNKVDLNKVFDDLKSARGKVDGSASMLLETVFQLRASNWGHSSEETSDLEQESDTSFDGMENKVYYDLDGEGLTNEESEFIATHMTANEDFDSEDFDPDELCDPEPEMDEEIQEAFKEFVRLSGKH